MAFLVPKLVVYAIVPVKRLGVSKRRLSKFLSSQERKVLTIAMLEDVLRALKASMVSEIVVVSSDQVPAPAAVRFGWRETAEPNLGNGAGLPASPFRTDAW